MSATARDSLRELCGDHFHGLITTTAYRQRRAALLDAAIAGPEPVPDADDERTEPRPPVKEVVDAPVATIAPAKDSPPPRRLVYIAAAVAAGLVLVLAVTWLLPDEEAVPPAAASAVVPAATVPEPAAAAPEDSSAFVRRFLEANTWSETTLSGFLFEWDQLTDSERAAVRGSEPFRALAQGLQSRILERRALIDTNNVEGVDDFRLLVSFARELELDPGVSDIEMSSRKIAKQEPPPLPSPSESAAGVAPGTPPNVGGANTSPDEIVAAPPPSAQPPSAPPAARGARPTPSAAAIVAAPIDAKAGAPPAPQAIVVSSRPCRRDVAAAVPLPTPDRRLCVDMIAEGVRGPSMIVLPAGQFTMGSNDEKSASPAHSVTIPEPFALSVYEISVGDFRRFCDDTQRQCGMLPAGRDDAPVTGVLWRDANDYAAWLTEKTGAAYRLPSEAEWEYAARAGTTTRYPFGDDINQAQAAFDVAGPMERSKTVAANEFGLRHMVGNVREWVADVWHDGYAGAPADASARGGPGTLRVTRGGAYGDSKNGVTCAARAPQDAIVSSEQTGFRLLRGL